MNSYVLRVQQLFMLILLLSLTTLTQSQTYPQYQDLFVNDYANLLNTTDAAQIRAQLQSLKAETGIELTVLTINSYLDYATDNSIESFATNLFNTWGIGNAAQNDGALILIALADREMRVELGGGYDSSYNRIADLVIDEYIVPAFRQEEYSRGILRGTEELALRLSSPQTSSSALSSQTSSGTVPSQPVTRPVPLPPAVPKSTNPLNVIKLD